jgi:hypothetical protein
MALRRRVHMQEGLQMVLVDLLPDLIPMMVDEVRALPDSLEETMDFCNAIIENLKGCVRSV